MSKKNLKVILNIGIPGSGKSTWAKEYIEKNTGWIIVSRDSFRFMLANKGICDNKTETLIDSLEDNAIVSALVRNFNVIVDKTHLKEKYINHMIDLCSPYADVDYRVFDVPLDVCIQRDLNRDNQVGESVIRRMYENYKNLVQTFHFKPVLKLKHRPFVPIVQESDINGFPNAVIFDIDGTLAIMGDRSPYDWKSVGLDSVSPWVKEQVLMHKSKQRDIILLSGRDGSCRLETEQWLKDNGIPFDYLYMREVNDVRKDSIIKRELYQNHIKDNFNVLCVYDDRLQVVKEWFKLGLFCFNVNQGLQEF